MAQTEYDVIVIGSGFGGAVCAMRTAESGMRVCVLERGPRLTPAMREAMAEGRRPILHERGGIGFVERPHVKGLMAVTGSAVGGGSQVYTAATIRAADEIFATGWPSGFSAATLAPYYTRVEEVIAPTTVPTVLARTAALESAGAAMNAPVTRLPLAMDWPADPKALGVTPETLSVSAEAMRWLGGGAATRKRTLDKTYLARAEAAGAEVRELHEAIAIAPRGEGYVVRFRHYVEGYAHEGTVTGRRVVLAAGTIGTVRLLWECRNVWSTLPQISGALGERFYTNGDFGALIVGSRHDFARDSGPPTTAWVDCWKEDRLYLMELGLFPSLPRLVRAAMGFWMGLRKASVWALGAMGFDDCAGRLVLERDGGLTHQLGIRGNDLFHSRTMHRLGELAEALGGKLMAIPDSLAAPGRVTVHPLGGAIIAYSSEHGVTDVNGEVFGHPGLFIADGSLLPTPIGRAPSMTITALAEKVAERLVSE